MVGEGPDGLITREDLDTVLTGFGDEMVTSEECEARDRVYEAFWAAENAYGWRPVLVIEGEVDDAGAS